MSSGRQGKEEEAGQWWSSNLSPRRLDHRQRVPTAITLHRLVPHPAPSPHPHQPTATTLKYYTPREVKAAQAKARHQILASRLNPTPTPMPGKTRRSPQTKQLHHNKFRQRQSDSEGPHPAPSCRLGGGEANLRIRQLTRLVTQISHTLQNLQDLNHPYERNFVAPLDSEIKRKRWAEFVRSARRNLFSLKQEVLTLERAPGPGERDSRHLRTLAAAARTLHTLLLALKSQAELNSREKAWKEIFREVHCVSQRVMVLIARVGVEAHLPTVKVNVPQLVPDSALEDGGSNQASSRVASDIDSVNLHILQPSHVRGRLARLAALRLKKKMKGRCKSTMTEKRECVRDIVLEPRKRLSPCPKEGQEAELCHPTLTASTPKVDVLREVDKKCHQPGSEEGVTSIALASQTNTSVSHVNLTFSQSDSTISQTNPPASQVNPQSPQTSLQAKDLTQQLSFLLQRVCKIEDSHKKTKASISEASRRSQAKSTTLSLSNAIQNARLALSAKEGSVPHLSLFGGDSQAHATGVSLSKNTGMSVKVPQQTTVDTLMPVTEVRQLPREEKTGTGPNETWPTNESVTEQVRRQKEEFWLSLAGRGFVRPPGTVPSSRQEVQQVLQLVTQYDVPPPISTFKHGDTAKESLNDNKLLKTQEEDGQIKQPPALAMEAVHWIVPSKKHSDTRSPVEGSHYVNEQCFLPSSPGKGDFLVPSHHSLSTGSQIHHISSADVQAQHIDTDSQDQQSASTVSQTQQSVSADSHTHQSVSSDCQDQQSVSAASQAQQCITVDSQIQQNTLSNSQTQPSASANSHPQQNVSVDSQVQQSLSADSSSSPRLASSVELHSFPSYDGVSSSATT